MPPSKILQGARSQALCFTGKQVFLVAFSLTVLRFPRNEKQINTSLQTHKKVKHTQTYTGVKFLPSKN